jgi:hypothetical protein
VLVTLRRAGLGDLHVFGLRGHSARGQQPVELGHAKRLAFFSARRALLWDSAAANTPSGNLISWTWVLGEDKNGQIEITMRLTGRESPCV